MADNDNDSRDDDKLSRPKLVVPPRDDNNTFDTGTRSGPRARKVIERAMEGENARAAERKPDERKFGDRKPDDRGPRGASDRPARPAGANDRYPPRRDDRGGSSSDRPGYGNRGSYENRGGSGDSRPPRDSRDSRPPFQNRDSRPPYQDRDSRPPASDRGDRPAYQDRGERPPFRPREDRPYAERGERPAGPPSADRPPYRPREDRPTGDRPYADRGADRPVSDRPPFRERSERPPYQERGERPPYQNRDSRPPSQDRGDRPAYQDRGQRPPFQDRGERPPFRPRDDRPYAERGDRPASPPRGDRPEGDRGERPPYQDRGERPPFRPRDDRPAGAPSGDRPPYRPREDRPFQGRDTDRSNRERSDRPPSLDRGPNPDRAPFHERGDRPAPDRAPSDRPPFRERSERPAYPERAERTPYQERGERAPYQERGERPPFRPREDRPYAERGDRPAGAPSSDRPPYRPREDRPAGDRPYADRGADRPASDRPPFRERNDRPAYPERSDRPAATDRNERAPYQDRGERPAFQGRTERPPFQGRSDRPPYQDRGDRPSRPREDRPFRPAGDRDERPRPVREPLPTGVLAAGIARWFSPCPRGLEPVLRDELAALGADDVRIVPGGVQFTGDHRLGMRVNLESRIASRVLRAIEQAPYRDEHDLNRIASRIDWASWFSPDCTIKVELVAQRSPLRSLEFTTLKVKDAICDRFRDEAGRRPSIDTASPDVRINVFCDEANATFYLDTSGEALFKRGWRLDKVAAPLRENLAAGLLALAGWQPDQPLIDPFCGSGTIAIEAAHIAQGRAPGLEREFAFRHLSGFDGTVWDELVAEARARINDAATGAIHGSDISIVALPAAQSNAKRAAVEIEWRQIDAKLIDPPTAEPGLVICNPPYGERVHVRGRPSVEEDDDDRAFFEEFGAALKSRFLGWRVAILSSDPNLVGKLRLKPARSIALYNGALACKLHVFEIRSASGDDFDRDEAKALGNRLYDEDEAAPESADMTPTEAHDATETTDATDATAADSALIPMPVDVTPIETASADVAIDTDRDADTVSIESESGLPDAPAIDADSAANDAGDTDPVADPSPSSPDHEHGV